MREVGQNMKQQMPYKRAVPYQPVAFNLAVLILFLLMGGAAGLKIFLVYLFLYFLPGYIVLSGLNYGVNSGLKFKELEKVALAIPVSYSFTILFFLLSRLGIKSINIWGVLFLYILIGAFHFHRIRMLTQHSEHR